MSDNIWVYHLGAACHLKNDDTGLYHVQEVNKIPLIDVGDGVDSVNP